MNTFDIIFNLIGIGVLFIIFPLILKKFSKNNSQQKIQKLEDELGYSFFKILDKKCSIKRLTKFDIFLLR